MHIAHLFRLFCSFLACIAHTTDDFQFTYYLVLMVSVENEFQPRFLLRCLQFDIKIILDLFNVAAGAFFIFFPPSPLSLSSRQILAWAVAIFHLATSKQLQYPNGTPNRYREDPRIVILNSSQACTHILSFSFSIFHIRTPRQSVRSEIFELSKF